MGWEYVPGGVCWEYVHGGFGWEYVPCRIGWQYVPGGIGSEYVPGGIGSEYVPGGIGSEYFLGRLGLEYVPGGIGSEYVPGGVGWEYIPGGLGWATFFKAVTLYRGGIPTLVGWEGTPFRIQGDIVPLPLVLPIKFPELWKSDFLSWVIFSVTEFFSVDFSDNLLIIFSLAILTSACNVYKSKGSNFFCLANERPLVCESGERL